MINVTGEIMYNSIHLPHNLRKKLKYDKKLILPKGYDFNTTKIDRVTLRQKVILYQPRTSLIEEQLVTSAIFHIGCTNDLENSRLFIKTFDHIHIEDNGINKLINHFENDSFQILWFTNGRFLKIKEIRKNYERYIYKLEESIPEEA